MWSRYAAQHQYVSRTTRTVTEYSAPFRHLPHQISGVHAERFGKEQYDRERRYVFTAFHESEIAAVHASTARKFVLRPSALFA